MTFLRPVTIRFAVCLTMTLAVFAATVRAQAPLDAKARDNEAHPYPVSVITGWAVDADQKSVAGVPIVVQANPNMVAGRVTILPLPGAKTLDGLPVAETDAKGCYAVRFMIASPLRAAVMVRVQTDKLRAREHAVTIYQGETVAAKPFLLEAYRTLRVRILNAEGKPVPGAQFYTAYHSREPYITGPDGVFTHNQVSGSILQGTVAAPGYEATRCRVAADDGEPTIRLTQKCKSVSGRVVDAGGKPLAGVRVYGSQGVHYALKWYTQTDAQGHFVMATMPGRGEALCIWPARDKAQIGPPQSVTPGARDVVVSSFAMGRIEVTVKDEKGEPLPGMQAWVYPQQRLKGDLRRYGHTDRDGRFSTDTVPAGEQVVSVAQRSCPGGMLKAEAAHVTVQAGETTQVALTCRVVPKTVGQQKPADFTVRGLLTDSTQVPVLHARVLACLRRQDKDGKPALYRGSALTQADGRFEIDLRHHDPMSHLHVRKAVSQWRSAQAPAPAEVNQVRIVAQVEDDVDRHSAMFRARSPRGGKGKANDLTYLVDATRDWPADQKSSDAGRLGARLPPVRIIALQTLRARPGSQRAWVQVTGCADAAGKPVACRQLEPRTPDEEGFPIAVRHAGVIKVTLRSRLNDTVTVTIPPDAPQPVAAVFQAPRHVELTLVDETGKPVSDVRLFGAIGRHTSKDYCLDSRQDGKIAFDISQSASGSFWLFSFAKPQYEPFTGEIKAGAEPVKRTIRLKSSTAELSGRLLDAQGKPVANVKLRANLFVKNATTNITVPVDANACFRTRLPAGAKISLQAQAVGAAGMLRGGTETIPVAAGQKISRDITLEDEKVYREREAQRRVKERERRRQEMMQRIHRQHRQKETAPAGSQKPEAPVEVF